MVLVVATFIDNLKSVAKSRSDGKDEICNGFPIYTVVIKIIRDKVILLVNKISSKKVGIGSTIDAKIAKIKTTIIASEYL